MALTYVSDGDNSKKPDIIRVRLFRNGDANFIGKEMVINVRQMRDIEQVLHSVTGHIDLNTAARSIRTAKNGHRVKAVADLEDKKDYVVVTTGKFQRLEYDKLRDRYLTRMLDNKKRSEENDFRKPLKRFQRNFPKNSPGRLRNTTLDVTPIYVYKNGDDLEPARRIILTRRMMAHWNYILAEISQHIQPQYSAVQCLYTLDGQRIIHKYEITSGQNYVAVGFRAPFKQMNYDKNGNKPFFNVSPRIMRRNLTNGVIPYSRSHVLSDDEEEESIIGSSSLPVLSGQSEPIDAAHRRRANRRKYRMYSDDGKQIFPQLAARPYRHQKPLPAIQDSDNGDDGDSKGRTTYRAQQEDYIEYSDERKTESEEIHRDVREQGRYSPPNEDYRENTYKTRRSRNNRIDDDNDDRKYRPRKTRRGETSDDWKYRPRQTHFDREYEVESMNQSTEDNDKREETETTEADEEIKTVPVERKSPRKTKEKDQTTEDLNDEKASKISEQSQDDRTEAAVKIQAAYKGYQYRKHRDVTD